MGGWTHHVERGGLADTVGADGLARGRLHVAVLYIGPGQPPVRHVKVRVADLFNDRVQEVRRGLFIRGNGELGNPVLCVGEVGGWVERWVHMSGRVGGRVRCVGVWVVEDPWTDRRTRMEQRRGRAWYPWLPRPSCAHESYSPRHDIVPPAVFAKSPKPVVWAWAHTRGFSPTHWHTRYVTAF